MNIFSFADKNTFCVFFMEVSFWRKFDFWPKFYRILLISFCFLNCKYNRAQSIGFLRNIWLLTFILMYLTFLVSLFELHMFYIFAEKALYKKFLMSGFCGKYDFQTKFIVSCGFCFASTTEIICFFFCGNYTFLLIFWVFADCGKYDS